MLHDSKKGAAEAVVWWCKSAARADSFKLDASTSIVVLIFEDGSWLEKVCLQPVHKSDARRNMTKIKSNKNITSRSNTEKLYSTVSWCSRWNQCVAVNKTQCRVNWSISWLTGNQLKGNSIHFICQSVFIELGKYHCIRAKSSIYVCFCCRKL